MKGGDGNERVSDLATYQQQLGSKQTNPLGKINISIECMY